MVLSHAMLVGKRNSPTQVAYEQNTCCTFPRARRRKRSVAIFCRRKIIFFSYLHCLQILGKKSATAPQGKGCTDATVEELVQQHKSVGCHVKWKVSELLNRQNYQIEFLKRSQNLLRWKKIKKEFSTKSFKSYGKKHFKSIRLYVMSWLVLFMLKLNPSFFD